MSKITSTPEHDNSEDLDNEEETSFIKNSRGII